ncbi:MAG: ABC transporter substrate-binding protein, partial [Lacrimispora sp.]
MRKSLKPIISLSLCAAMAAASLAGCSSGQKTSAETTVSAAAETTGPGSSAAASDKPFEGVKLKYATTQTASTGEENQKLIQLVKEKTGIDIEFYVIPSAKAGEVDKTLVSLMAGDEID